MDSLRRKATMVPIVDVIERMGVQLRRIGQGVYAGRCPFHDDEKISLKVYADFGRFICLSCEFRGDVVDYVAKTMNTSDDDAVGIILDMVQAEPEIMVRAHKVVNKIVKREPEYLDRVYKAFVTAAPPLTSEHVAMIESWGLGMYADDRRSDFFEFPADDIPFWRSFQRTLTAAGLKRHEDSLLYVLKGVPGFWYDREEKRLHHATHEGIGIVQHDMSGRISGLQVRSDNEEGWKCNLFSSGYHSTDDIDELKVYGANIGQIPDIIRCGSPRSFVITDNHKKGLVLRDTKNVTVLSLNGVGCTDPVIPFVQVAKGQCDRPVYIAFDADFRKNRDEAVAALKIADIVEDAGVDACFLIWEPRFGKGIDDLIMTKDKDAKICEVSRSKYMRLAGIEDEKK